jgi:hypothetical protein
VARQFRLIMLWQYVLHDALERRRGEQAVGITLSTLWCTNPLDDTVFAPGLSSRHLVCTAGSWCKYAYACTASILGQAICVRGCGVAHVQWPVLLHVCMTPPNILPSASLQQLVCLHKRTCTGSASTIWLPLPQQPVQVSPHTLLASMFKSHVQGRPLHPHW